MSITVDTYTRLNEAYDYFNKALFDGKLPECLITLAYHKGARGYFRDEPFRERTEKAKQPKRTDEIALNPFTFQERTDREILSTLVHEQVHLWQHHFGTVSKTHHNKEWAEKMEELGLMPSSTGAEGGKRTGRRVSHYIIDKGPYDRAWAKCTVKLNWNGLMQEPVKKGSKRVKYCCPECEEAAYGKPGLNLVCGDCDEPMKATKR